ncbi:hypothetical protein H4582DRAFT_2061764 [Lactarius indigo]|nr:hypothetical protein H4582DRAFT_2061764 [Lactarius indigo]
MALSDLTIVLALHLKLNAVLAAQAHSLFALLWIFPSSSGWTACTPGSAGTQTPPEYACPARGCRHSRRLFPAPHRGSQGAGSQAVRDSPQFALRLLSYNTLLELTCTNYELRAEVKKRLKKWEITPSQECRFLERHVGVFSKLGSLQRHGLPLRACSRPPAFQAMRPIEFYPTALPILTIFNFDPVQELNAVLAAQLHSFFVLFQIFQCGGLDDLDTYRHVHVIDITGEYGTYL